MGGGKVAHVLVLRRWRRGSTDLSRRGSSPDAASTRGRSSTGSSRERCIGYIAGIYAVGHPSLTSHGRWLAAVLASGPGATLSHRSAAALWRLLPADGGPVDVTGERARRGERGVRFHRARRLTAVERARVDGIAVTIVSRTLLDLAETCPTQLLDAAFDAALRRRLDTVGAYAACSPATPAGMDCGRCER